jgi:6-phosphogluconate dehydrogenase
MRLGMVGLGRMGSGMTRRLLRGGHQVVVHDLSRDAMAAVAEEGAEPVNGLEALVAALPAPRAIWLMLPAGPVTEQTMERLAPPLTAGDVLVDGGNARWSDSVARGERLAERGVHLVDVGTSGGVWGLEQGYCLMAGGAAEDIDLLRPVLETLAQPDGWAHVGPSGAGHFTKMVHNGIEYGLMESYAEGFELLAHGPYDLDLPQVAELWRHGSVVRSWLLDLAERAMAEDPKLERISGWVEDSGEGRWTLEAAIANAVSVPVLAASLFARFDSRREDAFGDRLVAALRNQFGGHVVRAAERRGHE